MEEAEGGMWCLMGRGCGPPTGRPASLVPGRATRRAGLAAHTRHALPGRASPGTMQAGPKNRAFGQAVGLQAAWTSIVPTELLPLWRSNKQ